MPSRSTKTERKPRRERKFPVITFEEALVLGSAIQEHAGGQKVRRLTLFEKLNQSPDGNETRRLITASSQYGLTKGSYNAEYLELTPAGIEATGEDIPVAKQISARFDLSIRRIPPFLVLYEKLKGSKLPAREIMMDNFSEKDLPVEERAECVDTFVLNATFLRLLRTISGSQRLVPLEQVLEEGAPVRQSSDSRTAEIASGAIIESVAKESEEDYAKICFFVTPIGEPGSEQRRHADFMLEYIIEPSVKEFRLTVIRADQMSKPGMIGKQIIEHILKARLVIADLSFHNPNVFYELCLRHTTRLPTVQLKREVDSIPFDLNQYRTVSIETRDPYTLLPKIQTYVAEVTNQVRRALANAESGDNPISLYYPNARLSLDKEK